MNRSDDQSSVAAAAMDLTDQIDRNLRRVYQEAIDDEVPDHFARLLDQLKERSAAQNGRSS